MIGIPGLSLEISRVAAAFAERIGLEPIEREAGDVILAVGGEPVMGLADFYKILKGFHPVT